MRITLNQDTFETWSGHGDHMEITGGLRIELYPDGNLMLQEVAITGDYVEIAVDLDALLPALQALADKRDATPLCGRCTMPTAGRVDETGEDICEDCADAE